MALSTSIPRARVKENKTTIFKVYPKACSAAKDKNIEKGMARPTRRAFLNPRATNNTITTRIRPEIILFSRSATISLISFDLFISLVIVVFFGNVFFASSTIISILSQIKIIFSPTLFLIEILTEFTPFKREREVSSLIPSTTVATSFR